MKSLIFLLFLFTSSLAQSQSWKKLVPEPASSITAADCPPNYIPIQKRYPDTYRDFCIAKYEMKTDPVTGAIASMPANTPRVSIDKNSARNACRSLGAGYELISNEQWQTVAKMIADRKENWSTGVAYSGELNSGHSDNSPASNLEASADDNDGCYGTGETCSLAVWNKQRRTHVLPGGHVIWDFAGNVWEWVVNPFWSAYGVGFTSLFAPGSKQERTFGISRKCNNHTVSPYCGYGWGGSGAVTGAAIRGGSRDFGVDNIGVFTADYFFRDDFANVVFGFRCVYVP
jgi:formylglycine-generating enzyme required for sulfatase activity